MCYGARLEVRLDNPEAEPVGSVPVSGSNEWSWNRAELPIPDGVHALYLKAAGFGVFSLATIRLETGGMTHPPPAQKGAYRGPIP